MHPSTLLLNQPLALSAGRTAIMARLFRDGALNCPGFCGDRTTREVRRIHEQQIEAFSA
ncbi:hypothetical protein LDL36_03265 [Komagataeibacter sp. FNDCR1]|nr:hypothetical protein [Komagataeibacter sp. FNDCR1]